MVGYFPSLQFWKIWEKPKVFQTDLFDSRPPAGHHALCGFWFGTIGACFAGIFCRHCVSLYKWFTRSEQKGLQVISRETNTVKAESRSDLGQDDPGRWDATDCYLCIFIQACSQDFGLKIRPFAPGYPGAPFAPKIVLKSCSFQAILSTFWAHGPPWVKNSTGPPWSKSWICPWFDQTCLFLKFSYTGISLLTTEDVKIASEFNSRKQKPAENRMIFKSLNQGVQGGCLRLGQSGSKFWIFCIWAPQVAKCTHVYTCSPGHWTHNNMSVSEQPWKVKQNWFPRHLSVCLYDTSCILFWELGQRDTQSNRRGSRKLSPSGFYHHAIPRDITVSKGKNEDVHQARCFWPAFSVQSERTRKEQSSQTDKTKCEVQKDFFLWNPFQGLIHTGCAMRRATQSKQMEHAVINWSVHTAHKQHQRICV